MYEAAITFLFPRPPTKQAAQKRQRLFYRMISKRKRAGGVKPQRQKFRTVLHSITGGVGMATAPRKSRVFTISMPAEMAAKAEAIAKQEHLTMSELFREAFRVYRVQQLGKVFEEIAEYAAARNPHGYSEEDIPKLVKEVRAEMRAEREAADLALANR